MSDPPRTPRTFTVEQARGLAAYLRECADKIHLSSANASLDRVEALRNKGDNLRQSADGLDVLADRLAHEEQESNVQFGAIPKARAAGYRDAWTEILKCGAYLRTGAERGCHICQSMMYLAEKHVPVGPAAPDGVD